MSDEQTMRDYIDDLLQERRALRDRVAHLEKQLQWAREDADMCRIYMTKWQMAYEEEKAKRDERA